MKRVFFQLIKITVAGLASIMFLSVFVYFIGYSGVHIENESGATDYKWEPYQTKTTIYEGFSWLKMDENGFNNVLVKNKDIDILLMGSSHMEAYNVAKNENVGYILNNKMDEFTYNIGISGHTIYSCFANLNAAIQYYKPQKYVIVETADIELNVEEMQHVLNGEYKKIPSYDTGGLYFIQKKIPAIKSLYKNIEEWKELDEIEEINTSNVVNGGGQEYEEVLNCYLKYASDIAQNNGVKLIVFYHPKAILESDTGNYIAMTDQQMLESFTSCCIKNNIIFADLSGEFEKLYTDKHILCHGFSNTAVGVGHLNKYGHELAANQLLKVMEEDTDDIK